MPWRNAGMLFVLMVVNYGLNTVAFRMVARGSYIGVAASDAMLAWWGFAMVKRITVADSRIEKLAYVVGGVLGSLIALRLTK